MRAAALGAQVIVTEIDPVKAMEAKMDGYDVMTMAQGCSAGRYVCYCDRLQAYYHGGTYAEDEGSERSWQTLGISMWRSIWQGWRKQLLQKKKLETISWAIRLEKRSRSDQCDRQKESW